MKRTILQTILVLNAAYATAQNEAGQTAINPIQDNKTTADSTAASPVQDNKSVIDSAEISSVQTPTAADSARIDSILSSQLLDNVVVTSQRQLVKSEADKLSYDVQGDQDSKTKTVIEMLRKVPLVTVDGEDNVKVKGSSTFKIYKNGHPDPSMSKNPKEVLKSIPASMVKRIEVITDPGAKYDAEGTPAILNIVMIDGARFGGVTGSVSIAANDHGSTNTNGFITTQLGKFIMSANAGMSHMNRRQTKHDWDSEQTYHTGETRHEGNENTNPGNIQYGALEASYEVDSLNLLTLSFGGYRYEIDVDGTGFAEMYNADGQLNYSYRSKHGLPSYSYQDWNGRMDYQHKTKRKDEVFTFSYMLSTTNSRNDITEEYSELINAPMNYKGYLQRSHERFYEHTFQADWVRPLTEHHKLESGVKYIYRLNKSETSMEYDGPEEDASTRFNHTTQVGAAYLQYIYSGSRWSARGGLRYEFSRLEGKFPDGSSENFHQTLNDWVPSATLNYKFSDANSLKLGLSTSISRPGISYLNPAIVSTPTSISFGNSRLESARNSRLELTFMHTGPKLTYNINPYYSFSNDRISTIQYLDNGKTVSTYGNVLNSRAVGMHTYAQWQPFAGTTLVINASVGHIYYKNPSLGLTMQGWEADGYAQLSQKLPWKLMLSASGGGQIGNEPDNVYGYSKGWHWYNFSLQRSFLKEDRLTVRLMSRPFGNKQNHWKEYTKQGDYTGLQQGHHRQERFALQLSWRFGKLNASVKKTEKTIENSDVVGGIKK